ncbi:MAG: hypothetical protein ABFD58_13450, partial [Anaerolineaceae bacterium]
MSKLKAKVNGCLLIWAYHWMQKKNSSQYLPEISGLDGNDASLLGILISHPHLDHFGLLTHISPMIPVGMGPAAR